MFQRHARSGRRRLNGTGSPRHALEVIAFSLESRLRLNLDHRPIVLFRQVVNQSVGSLADVPHALMELLQHRFPALLPQLVVENDTFQMAGAGNSSALDAADKDVALPGR